MLCEDCSSIQVTKQPGQRSLRTYKDVATLERSAVQGCDLCLLIRKSHNGQHERYDSSSKVRYYESVKHSSIVVSHGMQDTIDLESNISWACDQNWQSGSSHTEGRLGGFFAEESDPAATEIKGRRVPLDPGSDETLARANTWLETCITTHSRCPKAPVTPLPTRLIDIGLDTNPNHLRLVQFPKGTMGCYIALSYCWGTTYKGVLTKANIFSRRLSFSLSSQPKTITDAVLIARNFRIQYLWVDSLCIVQDSKEDWDRESSTMCDVYGNAYLTIQASRSADSAEGFLHLRPEQNSARLPYRTQDGTIGCLFVRDKLLIDPIVTEPLHRRGWTYQEALLAPRILSFGATEASWECKTCFVSEGGSSLWDTEAFVGLPKPIRRKTMSHFLPPGLVLNNEEIKRRVTWSFIISEYSQRVLKFEKDKLPALSGLARLVASERLTDKYVVGLWKNDLPEDLMWGFQGKASKSLHYRAPTWSWASKDGPLAVFDSNYGQSAAYCKVLNVSVTPSGLDAFGEVKGGVLTVRSQIMEGWRILDQSALASNDNVQFFYDTPRELHAEENTYQLKLGLCELDIHDQAQVLGVPVINYFMRIFQNAGLILSRVPNGFYERIGQFVVDDGKETWFGDCPYQEIDLV